MPYEYNSIPKSFWYFIGIAVVPIGIGIGALLLKTSQLEYTNKEGEILSIESKKDIKQASNNTQYANKVLLERITSLENTIDYFVKSQPVPDPTLQIIQQNVEQITPVIEELEKSNEELQEAVKLADLEGN